MFRIHDFASIIVCSMLFIGTVVAILVQWMNAVRERLAHGLTPITHKDHYVLLGWTSRTPLIAKTVAAAQESASDSVDNDLPIDVDAVEPAPESMIGAVSQHEATTSKQELEITWLENTSLAYIDMSTDETFDGLRRGSAA